jgi:predicted RNA binding protein YcfA (HicA-like mRNA interferase family)
MPSLPVISGQKCVKVLMKIGFIFDSQKGSHIILIRPQPKTRLSIPNHKELDRGTLRAIIRQAGLTVDQFIDLL